MSKIKLVSLLLACFAIIAASPLAMGVTIYGGTATTTTGAGVADGVNSATRTVDSTSTGGPAILDAYLYAHAGVAAGATGSAKAHFAGSVSGATFSPTTHEAVPTNSPLGTFSASASGDVNTGVTITSAPLVNAVNAYAIIGSKVLRQTSGTGARDNSPVQGTAYVFSKIDGSVPTTSIIPLGGNTLPELGTPVFDAAPISGIATGEAYARANGAAAFTGTAINAVGTKESRIYGNVNANTYVDATLDNAQTDSMAASVATAVAKPALTGAGVESYATAGVVTRLDLAQAALLDGRSNATATVTPGTGADYAAKAGAWDYTFSGNPLTNINENVFAASDASLESTANTRIHADAAGTGARVNTVAYHDLATIPLKGSEQYAATFIQTYGAGVRTFPGGFETQKMAYGSILDDAASYSIVRDNARTTTQSADIGALSPSLDQGFLAGGHMLSADATPQFASALFTQEAFGKMYSGVAVPLPYRSNDAVIINRQPATVTGILPAAVNDPYLFWQGAGQTLAVLPPVVTQGIMNDGPAWSGVAANDVGAAYGLTGSATANYWADNVKTDSVLSDINWIEGSSLMYNIQNLQKSFTYQPVGGFNNDFVVQNPANPTGTPYQQYPVSTNVVP